VRLDGVERWVNQNHGFFDRCERTTKGDIDVRKCGRSGGNGV
jgi:hypothetical protein